MRLSLAAVAGIAAGGSAAVAILTEATPAAAVAVIGLAVMVVTLRRQKSVFDDLHYRGRHQTARFMRKYRVRRQ